ncbi:desulfoferrodoxin [Fuchsiella alkaliacetigena]|uniref:desulfoferrodoxin n=1 Tax=Fuchsiella alkaliacetigena TaxID=957042 RepID=UPI00200B7E1D|nr:desulfoferrodoxin [Fuchsiella alkaliacetigena]MCK8825803.1 desulfoferrodoxin [Fuchsiella alkaliacetigena]
MTQLREVYKCEICGNVIEILHAGAPALVCCKQPMDKLELKVEEEGQEKHLPVVEETDEGLLIKVGSVAHPMEEKHYIQFIEVLTSEQVLRAELETAGPAEAEFKLDTDLDYEVRAYCNLHGLWKTV